MIALIEAPLHLIASIVSSRDYPLTHSGEAVCNMLMQLIHE